MGCCEWCSTHFRAPFRWIVCMIEIGIAIAIINIIYWHLTNLDVAIADAQVVDYQCLLAPQDKSDDLCVYAYVLCGASLVVCVILMVTVCLKCACWLYFDFWIDFAFTLAGVIWWLAGSLVLSAYAAKTNDQNDIQQSYRNSVTILAWIMTLCFFLDYVVSQSRLCYKVCGCCGGKAEKERLAAEKAKEKEEAERKKLEEAGGDVENPPKDVVPPALASELGKTPSASQPSAAKPSTTAPAASAPSTVAPAASAPSTAAAGNVTVEVVK